MVDIKKVIKDTRLFNIYLEIKHIYNLYKNYSNKYNTGFIKTIKEVRIVNCNLDEILDACLIKNVGIGNFFYSLDHKVAINSKNHIIGNIPMDYSFVINNADSISKNNTAILRYISRINDSRITTRKPQNLQEALQSILFWNSLLWQTGHTLNGLGRLDKTLSTYSIPDNAEDLICDFLKTLHSEYTFKSSTIKGDTGQIILLGGLEEDGSYFCNGYTKLFIKCLNKIHLPDPKILLRCSKNMPNDLLELSVDCIASGIGSPLFSNDDIIIPHLIDFGYERKDAFNYGVSACWEPLSIGNSLEQNNLAHIEFGKVINNTILDSRFLDARSINDVIELYNNYLKKNCSEIKKNLSYFKWEYDPLLSSMMNIEIDISKGGAKYNNYGVLSVGMSSAVNSILNIQKYVFDKKMYSLDDIQKTILENYNNNNTQVFAINEDGYGTDSQEAIRITNILIKMAEDNFKDYRNMFGGKVKFGLSSPVYVDFGKDSGATLDGRKAGEPFNTHISRDKGEPITEIMNFGSKIQLSGISSNANVIDVMIQASLIQNNIHKFTNLIMSGIKCGIFQLQINVLSYAQLIDAKAHPEKYPNLIVRVWGFSAYFNDLPNDYKDNLIRRAKEMEHVA